jgi:glutamate synthase (NADPH/NADH) large chain
MTGGRAVILGPTGRNFGAGMSGGIAFVHDPTDIFPSLVNYELVELEPLDESDAETIRTLVESHLRHTGSPVAARVLEEWDDQLPLFAKVMPRDYKRVLLASQNGHPVAVGDVISSGGEGFLTTESETAQAAG